MIPLGLALAGGLGAAARFAVDAAVGRRVIAIVLVNVTGSFLLGLLVGAGAGDDTVAVLGTGFLGGYTTFSTASVQTATFLLERRPAAAIAHGLGVLVICVAAASAGFALGRL